MSQQPAQKVTQTDVRNPGALQAIDPATQKIIWHLDANNGASNADPGINFAIEKQAIDFAPEYNEQLARIRHAFPFLEIQPHAPQQRTFQGLANAAFDIPVPIGALLCRLTAGGAYQVSTGAGNAAAPTATGFNGAADGAILGANMTSGWFFCGNIRTISVRAIADNSLLSAEFFVER